MVKNNRYFKFSFAILTTMMLLKISSSAWSATYYVDALYGHDGNSGLSPSSSWKTVEKVSASKFQPGDSVLFKRGQIWRDKLLVRSSGSNGNHIKFGAYGSGGKPIISGANLITGWTKYNSYSLIWRVYLKTRPYIVYVNGARGKKVSSIAKLGSEKEWIWVSNYLYLYSSVDPNKQSSPGIEAGARATNIIISNKSYITIENFDVRHANGQWSEGIGVVDSDNVIIQDCTARNNHDFGINITGISKSITIDNCDVYNNENIGINVGSTGGTLITNCRIHDQYFSHGVGASGRNITITMSEIYNNPVALTDQPYHFHNVYFSKGSDNVKVEYCNIYDSKDGNGLSLSASNAMIRYNRIYNNLSTGIITAMQTIDNGIVNIYGNLIYGNNKGIDINSYQANLSTAYNINNNVIADNNNSYKDIPIQVEIDIDVERLNFYNNIVYSSNTSKGYYLIWAAPQSNMNSDHNCFFGGSGFYYYNARRSFEQWKSSTGGDTNSENSNPLFLDKANYNFHLNPNSPCIDSGMNVGITNDFDGVNIPQGNGPDMGAFEYKDNGVDKIDPPKNLKIIG